jgi:heme A synthase
MTRVHRFAVATCAATFVLLLVGGMVNPTGSSLACPDWPLCHGQVFPRMVGGVLFEHTHRLVATAVGLMTVVLAVLLSRRRRGKLGLLAVAMVVAQGVLGGLTVLLKLPPEISIAHLALSMAFFALTVYIAWITRPAPAAAAVTTPPGVRVGLVIAAACVYLQIVLGAVVRHLHAALACLDDVPLCYGQLWPTNSYMPQIHMAHRLFAVVAGVVVIVASLRAAPQLRGWPRKLAIAAPVLVVLQIGLGVLTVLSMKAIAEVEAHLGVGVLLLLTTVLLALATPTRRVAATAPVAPRGVAAEARS